MEVAFRGWNDAWLDSGFKAWNIEDKVGRWRVPALLIQGADDQYGTLAQIRSIEARSPALVESLILDACRHSPQIDQPEATLQAIADTRPVTRAQLAGIPGIGVVKLDRYGAAVLELCAQPDGPQARPGP